jgi:ATP-dependent Clp protease ATP-binding subunit ClpC
MPALHVRNVPEPLYEQLRARAEREGRSINGEAIAILEEALSRPSPTQVRATMTKVFRRRQQPPGMFQRFTERARRVVVASQENARALRHPHVGTEHLLLGLFDEERGLAAQILATLGVTRDEVQRQVGIPGEGPERAPGQIPFSPVAKQALERALRESLAMGHDFIGTEHVLLGVLQTDGTGARILGERGVDPDVVREAIGGALGAAAPPSHVVWPEPPWQWEYRVEELAEPLAESLRRLPRGWELVSVTGTEPELRAILKRRAA